MHVDPPHIMSVSMSICVSCLYLSVLEGALPHPHSNRADVACSTPSFRGEPATARHWRLGFKNLTPNMGLLRDLDT